MNPPDNQDSDPADYWKPQPPKPRKPPYTKLQALQCLIPMFIVCLILLTIAILKATSPLPREDKRQPHTINYP